MTRFNMLPLVVAVSLFADARGDFELLGDQKPVLALISDVQTSDANFSPSELNAPNILFLNDRTLVFRQSNDEDWPLYKSSVLDEKQYQSLTSLLTAVEKQSKNFLDLTKVKGSRRIAPAREIGLFTAGTIPRAFTIYGLVDKTRHALPKEFVDLFAKLDELQSVVKDDWIPKYYEIRIWTNSLNGEMEFPANLPWSWPKQSSEHCVKRARGYSIFVSSAKSESIRGYVEAYANARASRPRRQFLAVRAAIPNYQICEKAFAACAKDKLKFERKQKIISNCF